MRMCTKSPAHDDLVAPRIDCYIIIEMAFAILIGMDEPTG